jgi:hypothetical protein
MYLASREHGFVLVTEGLEKIGIHKRREAESQRWDFSEVNGTSHYDEFFACSQGLSCISKNHLAGWSNSHAISASIEDRKLDLFFEVTNLFAE